MYEDVLRSFVAKINKSEESYNGKLGTKDKQEQITNLQLAIHDFNERLMGIDEKIKVLVNQGQIARAPAGEDKGECILPRTDEKSEIRETNLGYKITAIEQLASPTSNREFCVIIAKCKLDSYGPPMATPLFCAATNDGCPTASECLAHMMANYKMEKIVFDSKTGIGKIQANQNKMAKDP